MAHLKSNGKRPADLVRLGKLHPEMVTAQVVGREDAPEALAVHDTKTIVSRLN